SGRLAEASACGGGSGASMGGTVAASTPPFPTRTQRFVAGWQVYPAGQAPLGPQGVVPLDGSGGEQAERTKAMLTKERRSLIGARSLCKRRAGMIVAQVSEGTYWISAHPYRRCTGFRTIAMLRFVAPRCEDTGDESLRRSDALPSH